MVRASQPTTVATIVRPTIKAIIDKMDPLRRIDFDVGSCMVYARRTDPEIEVLQMAARRGKGPSDRYLGCAAGQER